MKIVKTSLKRLLPSIKKYYKSSQLYLIDIFCENQNFPEIDASITQKRSQNERLQEIVLESNDLTLFKYFDLFKSVFL